MNGIKHCFILILVVILVTGCSGMAFNKAKEVDKIANYEEFISNYPDEVELALKAKLRIEELVYEQSKKTNSIYSYKNYLKKYPIGIFSKAAKSSIESISYQNAKQFNTVKSYEEFLGNYPAGRYTKEAKYLLEESVWKKAKNLDSIESYQWYLRDYKKGRYSSPATQLVKMLSNKSIHRQYSHLNKLVNEMAGDFQAPQKYLNLYNRLYYTKKQIVLVNSIQGPCREVFILGKQCITNVYSGKVLKNDLILMLGNKTVRTLHTVNALSTISASHDEEAYGDFGYLKEANSNLFTKQQPGNYAKKYYPTKFVKEVSSWSGFLHDIGKWMKNNPEITAALGVAAYSALSTDNDNSSYSTSSKSVNNDACINDAINTRIATCNVVPQFDCNMIGCPDDKIECDKGWSGRACEHDAVGVYYINTFGLKDFYCDTENNDNIDSDINVVINNICAQN